MATYTKSLSSDFSGALNPDQLIAEIEAAVGIGPTCVTVFNTGDDVNIKFTSTLSIGEQIILNGLVSAHNAVLNGDISTGNSATDETTSTSYQTRDTLTTAYIYAGNYKIDWFYTFKCDNGVPDIRVIIDDTTTIHINNKRVPVVSSTLEYDKIGFDIQTLTEGKHTIKLQYRGNSTSSTSITKSCLFLSVV